MDQMEETKKSVKSALAALETETREVVQASKRLNENLVEAVRRTWRQLLLIWVVVIALAISYFILLSRGPQALNVATVPQDAGVRPETAATSPADTFPAIPERDELVIVLNQIREAQYKKDIDRFLQAYAPAFPELNRKREQTLTIWRRYDYLDLQFHVTDIRHQDQDTIVGAITWDIKARDRKTDTVKSLAKSYRVQFSKASGQWLIQKLDAADDQDTSDQRPG
jgi:hypothetical protein